MKKFLTILIAALMSVMCAFGLTACDEEETAKGKTLYVYTNSGFAPYEYLSKDGAVVGVDIEIMKEIGEVLGYNIEVKDIDFEQILNEVASNKNAVGAAGMTKKESRDLVALASISYATSVQYVIVPKNTFDTDDLVGGKLSLSKLSELSNKKVGTQSGTTGYYMVDDAIQLEDGDLYEKGMSCFTYDNAIVASQDIGSQIGAVVIDKLPAMSICAANTELECFELDAEPESYDLYFNKEATELVEKVNKVLQTMIDNGVINYFTIKHSGGITA